MWQSSCNLDDSLGRGMGDGGMEEWGNGEGQGKREIQKLN